ncbi:hypothetical protein D3C71_1235610 [compost metagenome]
MGEVGITEFPGVAGIQVEPDAPGLSGDNDLAPMGRIVGQWVAAQLATETQQFVPAAGAAGGLGACAEAPVTRVRFGIEVVLSVGFHDGRTEDLAC